MGQIKQIKFPDGSIHEIMDEAARQDIIHLQENMIIEETDPTVPDWAKQSVKPAYTADEVGALSAEKLPEAISEALAQAKESGEFDGEDGLTPYIGINGNWWIGEDDTGVSAGGTGGSVNIPFYDLAALGLPMVKTDNTISELTIDTTAIRAALDKGAVKFALNVDGSGPVEVIMNKYEANGLYICTYTAFNLTLTLMIAANGLQASAAEMTSVAVYSGEVEVI